MSKVVTVQMKMSKRQLQNKSNGICNCKYRMHCHPQRQKAQYNKIGKCSIYKQVEQAGGWPWEGVG